MRCDGCKTPPDERRWQDRTLGFVYCINCVDKKQAPSMRYIFEGFDGNEFCPSDPAFWERFKKTPLGELMIFIKRNF